MLLLKGVAEIACGLMSLAAWYAPIGMSIAGLWSWFRSAPYDEVAAWFDSDVFPLMNEDPRSWELSPLAHERLRAAAIKRARA